MENIEAIMQTTLGKLKEVIEADNVVGKPIDGLDGSKIIPISKVSFGFVTGGGEYSSATPSKTDKPYAGGSGGGVSIAPIGFLVCGKESKFIPAEGKTEEKKWTGLAKSVLNSLKK